MTKQEALNRNIEWFFTEGHGPALKDGETVYCVYWGDEGRKRCGVGCLLKEETAKKLQGMCDAGGWSEGMSINSSQIWPVVSGELGLDLYDHDFSWFLRRLQMAHDEAAAVSCFPEGDFWGSLERRLRPIAELEGLTVPEGPWKK